MGGEADGTPLSPCSIGSVDDTELPRVLRLITRDAREP